MPTNPSDFEKNNLEAHVQICGERHKALNLRMDGVDRGMIAHNDHDNEVHAAIRDRNLDLNTATNLRIDNLLEKIKGQEKLIETLQTVLDKNETRIVTWGVGIIAALVSALGYIGAKHMIF